MKKIISTVFILAFVTVFVAATSFAQQLGTRVEAKIPFNFSIGKRSFAAGDYQLRIVRHFGSVYAVSLIDESGNAILRTVAIQNGNTSLDRSEMVFAVAGGERYLESLRTPDAGFYFSRSSDSKRIAGMKRVTLPADSAPNLE